ncbi:phage tail tape measure protein, partial [Escherichia coli]|nr:phage tail tape measure protein [Escherichia coli]
NSTTAGGSRLMTGAVGLGGGGPRLVMLGAAAWYTLYQNQGQGREAAGPDALTKGENADKTPAKALPGALDKERRTTGAAD